MNYDFDYEELLQFIDPAALDYQEWINVGMALKKEGCSVQLWDSWSQRDYKRYHTGECEKKWNSFLGSSMPVTGATIVQMAKENGWGWISSDEGHTLDWDDEIRAEGVIIDTHYLEGRELKRPRSFDPVNDIKTYLETLFSPDEIVGYVVQSYEKDGKFIPANKGNYHSTAGELIEGLSKCGGDIGAVLGDYNEQGGAWIRFNPLDGKGVKNENVTEYRYALVESDSEEIEKQNAILRELELPIACLVYSGGKSLHAIVKIDAADYTEYRKRVDYLYEICRKNGLEIDRQNRNPSRLSRMPGIKRGAQYQYIVDTNIGKESFNEWKEFIDSINDDLPDFETFADIADDLPDLSPVLIDGILRQGHKMLLAGPAKAGKSFALIELATAIASGSEWLGFKCAKGKVLYVNLEIDRASYLHRIADVCNAAGISKEDFANIDFWSLRGMSVPMDKLTPKLIRRAIKKNYIAIIIDPIYKVITGDENSAEEMAKFCNQFDKIAHDLHCAVIYCHHHSKGTQGWKNSMDRASGSGVFARDPDALLDMIELSIPSKALEEDDKIFDSNTSAWRIEGTLREFPSFKPRNVFYIWPVHQLDDDGLLDTAVPKGSRENNIVGKGKASGTQEERDAETLSKLIKAFKEARDPETKLAKAQDVADKAGKSKNCILGWFKKFPDTITTIDNKAGLYKLNLDE